MTPNSLAISRTFRITAGSSGDTAVNLSTAIPFRYILVCMEFAMTIFPLAFCVMTVCIIFWICPANLFTFSRGFEAFACAKAVSLFYHMQPLMAMAFLLTALGGSWLLKTVPFCGKTRAMYWHQTKENSIIRYTFWEIACAAAVYQIVYFSRDSVRSRCLSDSILFER